MGRSKAYKYVITISYIDFVAKRPATMVFGSDKKVNAEKWRLDFNDSFANVNAHLKPMSKFFTKTEYLILGISTLILLVLKKMKMKIVNFLN